MKKIFYSLIFTLACGFFCFGQENTEKREKTGNSGTAAAEKTAVIENEADGGTKDSGNSDGADGSAKNKPVLSFSTNTDFAYYFGSDYKTGGDHFAPVTKAYDGVEFRVTGFVDYKIPTPMGNSGLTKTNFVNLEGSLEVTPVTFLFGAEALFSPAAFLEFAAGVKLGSGWDLASWQGLGYYSVDYNRNPAGKYETLNKCSQMYQYYYLQGRFQFDLAAVIPGKWNHIVTQATARYYWHGMTKMGEGDVWNFKTVCENANGFKYDNTILLGYRMPLVLNTVALVTEFEGYLNGEDAFGSVYHDWDPNFMTIEFAPTFVFKFTEKDYLTTQLSFKSRRSLETYTDETADRILLKTTGREWYFRRIALRYSHYF